MKQILIAVLLMAATAAHAQNPLSNAKYNIDTAITNKTASKSISPTTVGTQMKGICDAVNTYYIKKTDSTPYTLLSGTPAALPPTGGAGGSLAGSYPNPTLGTNSVGYNQLNAGSATPGQYLQWNGSALGWSNVSGGGGVDRLGAHVYYMSKLGFVDSADLSFFPKYYGPNQTVAMQGLLDSAKYYSNGITIYVDVCISADSLKINSNTTLIGLNNGGFLERTNSFAGSGYAPPLLRNADTAFGHTIDSNITIQNVIFNGSGFSSSNTRYAAPVSNSYGICAPIAIYGVDRLNIVNCKILNSVGYLIETNSITNSNFIDCYGQHTTFPGWTNRDGFHIDGASKHCRMIRAHVRNAGDDVIAVNGCDIYYRDAGGKGNNPVDSWYPQSANGNPDDVKAYDTFIDSTTGSGSGFRYFVYAPYKMTDCGDYGTHGVISGGYHHIIDRFDTSYGEGYYGTVTIDDCHVLNQNLQGQTEEIRVTTSINNLIIRNYINEGIELTPAGQYNRSPMLKIRNPQGAKIKIGALIIDGYQCKDTTSTYNTNHFYLGANATIDNFLVTGSSLRRVNNPALSSSTFVYQEAGDTINNMSFSNCGFNKLQYMAILYGYTKYAKRTGVTITGNINNSGYGGYAVVNTGRIDVMDDNGFSVDSNGTSVYVSGGGSVGNQIGSYSIQKTFVNKYTTNTLAQDLTARRIKSTSAGSHIFMSSTAVIPDTVEIAQCYGTFTATLPTGAIDGQHCTVMIPAGGTGTVTINPGGYTITAGQGKNFVYDLTNGSGWVLVSKSDGTTASIGNDGTSIAPAVNYPLITKGLTLTPNTYWNNATHTITSTEPITTTDGTSTITLLSSDGVLQFVNNRAGAGICTVQPLGLKLPPGASALFEHNNGLYNILASHGLTYNNIPITANSTAGTLQTIAHGLVGITGTSTVQITANDAAAGGFLWAYIDPTNIYITYPSALAAGNLLNYTISVRP